MGKKLSINTLSTQLPNGGGGGGAYLKNWDPIF